MPRNNPQNKIYNLPNEFISQRPLPKQQVVNPETGLTKAEEDLLEEFLARQPYDPLNKCFDLQRKFILDSNTRKSLLCSRRSGKTTASLQYLIKEALAQPNSIGVYIGIDRKSAKKIMWTEIEKLVEAEKQLKATTKLNHSELTLKFKNGSQIWVTGATDEKDIEKLRGNKFVLVIIDEAASFPESLLTKLVQEVIEPALIDLDGTLCLVGTPGAHYTDESMGQEKAGMFYSATTFDKEWGQHGWTLLQNPHIKNPQAALDKILKKRRWTTETPAYQREYLGKWVRSTETQVYKYSQSLSDYTERPKRTDWIYLLSLDVGTRDATAFVLSCFSEKDPNWYILEAYSQKNMAPDAVAEKIKSYKVLFPIERVIMDCGGLGLAIAEHFRTTHHLAITPAEKKEKYAFIEFFNGDMMSGRIKIKAGEKSTGELIDQWHTLTLGDDGKEEKHAPNDLCDAALYGYRHARQYLYAKPVEVAPPPTPDQVMEKHWADLDKQLRDEDRANFSYLVNRY